MLFNSYTFLLGFLPLVFAGFFIVARRCHSAAILWLGVTSLFFYGWGSIRAVPLLLISISANYAAGRVLALQSGKSTAQRRAVLWIAVSGNLALLGVFKYADFFLGNFNSVMEAFHRPGMSLPHHVLPIGISFYTFTQIAFLVDCWRGKVKEAKPGHYLLFVTYFPHLIAGPVLHHSQMMPQFSQPETFRINPGKVALGLIIFTLGLSKKLHLADPLGDYAGIVFAAAEGGAQPMFFGSWMGVLAYTFQIYFDFSGYSDMAIGISLLFGIRLPINFDSPYRATSIIDFWRRWHITLSAFLRDYLYIPLGGSRAGKSRRYFNLLLTMVLGGLWHGASWTFVMWGTLHGGFLVINHAWRRLAGESHSLPGRVAGWALTFLAVVCAWVLFRAERMSTAKSLYAGMLGQHGISLPASLGERMGSLPGAVFEGVTAGIPLGDRSVIQWVALLAVALLIALIAPSTSALYREGLEYRFGGRVALTSPWMAIALGGLLTVAFFSITKVSPFLYFQF